MKPKACKSMLIYHVKC